MKTLTHPIFVGRLHAIPIYWNSPFARQSCILIHSQTSLISVQVNFKDEFDPTQDYNDMFENDEDDNWPLEGAAVATTVGLSAASLMLVESVCSDLCKFLLNSVSLVPWLHFVEAALDK